MSISSLPYNGEVSELTWPQPIEIKTPKLRFVGTYAFINSKEFHIDTSNTVVTAKP